jgi:glycogen phosphorylase
MSIESLSVVSPSTDLKAQTELASQYGVADFGTALHGLYERHLLLDNSVDPAVTNAREHYEAFARSLRDILAHRWVRTNRTYHSANPKRIYYLSMEFLIGRSGGMDHRPSPTLPTRAAGRRCKFSQRIC